MTMESASVPSPTPATTPGPRAPTHFEDADGLFKTVCRGFMGRKCAKKPCKFVHDRQLCGFYWKTGTCKFGDGCRKNHFVTVTAGVAAEGNDDSADKTDTEDHDEPLVVDETKPSTLKKEGKKKTKTLPPQEPQGTGKAKAAKPKRAAKKNTECFEPMNKPVDLRITYDLGGAADTFSTSLTARDVLLAPNVFGDFKPGELYTRLQEELEGCGIPEERLLKLWHGNDKIEGTHLIADDKTRWKQNCPTFQLVIDRIKAFFRLQVQATRFNWYKDTSQWKPFHFDAAAVKPEIAAKQNFTVAVSFGATRDAAFEHAGTKTVVSLPQPDGCVYAFARDTNIIWRHGILQDIPVRNEGRISVIAWGWIDGMAEISSEEK